MFYNTIVGVLIDVLTQYTHMFINDREERVNDEYSGILL